MKYTYHVSGTHCASCKILIEDILSEQDFIKSVKVDLKNETAGRVVKINLPEGKTVKTGTLLVKLFDEDLQANLRK